VRKRGGGVGVKGGTKVTSYLLLLLAKKKSITYCPKIK